MILGAVLAGGLSSRFGSDKALALWQGRPLLEHVVERLGTVCAQVIVCGRADAEGLTIPDRPRAGLGPLGGLAAALHHAETNGFDRVLAAPCDAPQLSDELLAALASASQSAFVRDMPVIGRWSSADAARLENYLAKETDRSMRAWAQAIGATALHLPPPLNINRPADLEHLRTESSSV